MVRNLVQAEGRRVTRRCSLSLIGLRPRVEFRGTRYCVAWGVAHREDLCFGYALGCRTERAFVSAMLRKIGRGRQAQFVSRFGTIAEEIFVQK